MDDEDIDILAWTMLGEAGGEGTQGMADVGHVVLNRLETGRWGSTIKDVAQANKQFSTWNSGAGGNNPQGKYPKSSAAFQRARQLAQQVVAGQIQGPPGKPLDYHATNITPYWADSKDRFGAIVRNGHKFYPSVPVPPGEVPNSVGSLTDTIPGRPPLPVTATPDMAMMRRAAMPSQLIPATFAKLPKPNATRNLGDSLGMNPVQGGTQQAPMFDAAYDTTMGAMRLVQPVDTQGMGTFASAPKPALMSPQLAGRRATDPALQTALNAKVAAGNKPSVSASDLTRGRSGISTVATYPTSGGSKPSMLTASDRARGRSGISTVASFPTTGIGQPPATKVVQSVPMPPPRPALTPAYNPLTSQQKLALMGGGAPAAITAGLPQVPGPAGSINNNKDQSQLAPNAPGVGGIQTAMLPYPKPPINRPVTAPVQVAASNAAPLPLPRPSWMPAVATQLATTPPKVAPIPLPRPNFGMGGPVLNGPVPTQGLAPTPMPRLQRKGLSIGPLQVGGPIGALTTAMANSSGPFNNGGDNLLYNVMRGGDFNTPGAATHKSKSGYLFAPNGQGGFINVGRANPQLSPAQVYAMANVKNYQPSLEDRITGRSSSSGGGANSISSI